MNEKHNPKFGVIIYNVKPNEYAEAVRRARRELLERYHCHAQAVALPSSVNAAALLTDAPISDTPASPGTVIVWGE